MTKHQHHTEKLVYTAVTPPVPEHTKRFRIQWVDRNNETQALYDKDLMHARRRADKVAKNLNTVVAVYDQEPQDD